MLRGRIAILVPILALAAVAALVLMRPAADLAAPSPSPTAIPSATASPSLPASLTASPLIEAHRAQSELQTAVEQHDDLALPAAIPDRKDCARHIDHHVGHHSSRRDLYSWSSLARGHSART